MTKKETHVDQASELRQRAEELVQAAQAPDALEALSPEQVRQALHELQVHQIELEMQNEELRRAQAELEASRARYFDLYDLAPVGYITLSEHGLILEANLTAAKLLGVVRGALAKQPLARFILPEDQDIYYRHRQQLFATGAPQVCDLRLLRADGEPFWARLEASAAQDADGAPVCRVVVSDISESKQAEAALRESEHRFHIISELVSDYAYVLRVKPDGTLEHEWMTAALSRITDFTPEELSAMGGWMNLPHPKDKDIVIRHRLGCLAGREETSEYRILTKSGEVRWLHEHSRPIRDEVQGCVVRIYGAVQDITARKQAEEILELEAVRLQTQLALHKMMDAPLGQLLDFALEALTQTTQSQFAFIGLLDQAEAVMTIHAWSKDAMAQCAIETRPQHFAVAEAGLWGECVRQRRPVIVNAYADRPDKRGTPAGHVPIERFLAVPIFDGDRIVAVGAVANKASDYIESDSAALTLLTDRLWGILRRKQTEEALQQANTELQASLEQREWLVRDTYHRVKNNLMVIETLLKFQAGYVQDPAVLDMFTESQGRVRAMLLIHERLHQSADLTQVDFEAYLHKLAVSLFHAYKPPSLAVELAIDVQDVSLSADTATSCGLLVNELMSNAMKHAFRGRERGNLSVSFGRAPRLGEGEYVLAVSDDGVGLPPNTDWSGAESLGMRIVKAKVSDLGGKLEIECNGGTTFRITF